MKMWRSPGQSSLIIHVWLLVFTLILGFVIVYVEQIPFQ